jgi:ubiquinone/menaquinone biosynthesis C-methylase UbiE
MSRAIWNLRAAFYDRVFGLPFFKGLREREEAVFEELVRELELKDARILDLACGTGCYLGYFDKGRLYGLDISENMLKVSKSKTNACLVLGDARSLPFKDGSMGLVVSVGLLEYFREKQEVLREIRRVLKKGGYALISYSRRSPLNALRSLLGSRVYGCSREEMAISLNKCRLEWVKDGATLLQGQVLCKKA